MVPVAPKREKRTLHARRGRQILDKYKQTKSFTALFIFFSDLNRKSPRPGAAAPTRRNQPKGVAREQNSQGLSSDTSRGNANNNHPLSLKTQVLR